MESIGERLISARENKKLSVRDVVKDTRINPVYIKALEEEDFEKFPSETYLIGFLRSYSQYLKLDTEEIIQATAVADIAAKRNLQVAEVNDMDNILTNVVKCEFWMLKTGMPK